MANIKSQIKRNRQNEKARLRNKAVKSELKTSVRKFREAADSGDADAATAAMRAACRSLDKAASKGVIHKNQAANRKSAIAKRPRNSAALRAAPGSRDHDRERRSDDTKVLITMFPDRCQAAGPAGDDLS